jgi:hypothetical protein
MLTARRGHRLALLARREARIRGRSLLGTVRPTLETAILAACISATLAVRSAVRRLTGLRGCALAPALASCAAAATTPPTTPSAALAAATAVTAITTLAARLIDALWRRGAHGATRARGLLGLPVSRSGCTGGCRRALAYRLARAVALAAIRSLAAIVALAALAALAPIRSFTAIATLPAFSTIAAPIALGALAVTAM